MWRKKKVTVASTLNRKKEVLHLHIYHIVLLLSDMLRHVRGNMEVTGLGMRLMVMALFLLMAEDQKCCHAQKSEGAYLHVHPNRFQFFEYDSISLNCSGFDGPAEWRVIKKLGLNSTQWETSTRTLYIKPAFKSHSGEYWCEKEDGEKSMTVNITITGGDVILEISAFPVMEGENVTLGCRKKGMPSNLPADFYKDGHKLETGYGGKITIPNVSKSNEGLYKCIFSEFQGKSPESWLTVRVDIVTTPQETIPREYEYEYERSPEETPNSTEPSILLSAVFTTLGVAVLVVIGVLYHQKHKACASSGTSAPEYQRGNVADPDSVTYAAVTVKPKRERVCKQTNESDPDKTTYATVANQRKDRGH
ncbi:low affinity immunoglobulin gamma Fc region receptor II-like isoform X2 [Simochromis diagramma]|uniref:low affinity immunoglobulin gamma Fc region receptor II-like isoform X2 n=1 Tax=Simochromis diagramma TaxID=43689 RepID=UPI001A7EC424|nr:low affinity immunoglobulin gamma Fc region receptor II-like isoform X2 [Simochromis diagramma]